MKTTIMMKPFALLLALLLVVPCFSACNIDLPLSTDTTTFADGTTDSKTSTTTADEETTDSKTSTTTADEETTDPEPDPIQYPNLDYYEYKVYGWFSATNSALGAKFYVSDFCYKEPGYSKDLITVSSWNRTASIENDYNCAIRVTTNTTNHFDELAAFHSAGKKFDLAVIADTSAIMCATKGLLTDLASQKNIDLSKNHYNQNAVRQLSVGKKLFYLTGEMNTNTLDNTAVTLVNTTLLEPHLSGETIYDLVLDGKWTMDKKMALALEANYDANDDHTYAIDQGDIWGYLPYGVSPYYHFYGFGGRIYGLDEEAETQTVTIHSTVSQNAIEKVLSAFHTSAIPEGISPVGGGMRNNYFKEGKVLFTDTILWDVRRAISVFPVAYAVVPMPLIEAAQYDPTDVTLGYHSPVYFANNGTHALWAIPTTHDNTDYATLLFDAFAERSVNEGGLSDAYRQNTLHFAALKNEKALAVYDIIQNTPVLDFAGYRTPESVSLTTLLSKINKEAKNPTLTLSANDIATINTKLKQLLQTIVGN